MGVYPGPADMRRAAKLAVKFVGPGVLRAGDRAGKLSRFVDKYHAAMPADIFEDIDLAFGIAHQQQRRAKDFTGLTMPSRATSLPNPTAAQLSRNRVSGS